MILDAFSDHRVGAGPDKFAEFVPGQRVVLERWDGYWKAALIELLVPERVGNACWYDNPDVIAAVLETRDATLDDEELVDAWAGFQQAVYDDLPVFNIATQGD